MKETLLMTESLFSRYSGDLGFYVRSIGEHLLYPPLRPRVKTIQFGEIFWCIAGCGLFEHNGKIHQLSPGWVWYYPPGSLHAYLPGDEGFHCRWLTIEGPMAGELFAALGIQPGAVKVGNCPVELFCNIEKNIRKPGRQLHILQEAFKILTEVSAPGQLKHLSVRRDLAAELKQIIDEEFDNPMLNVDLLSARIDRMRVTAGRIFRKRYGITISDYLMQVRHKEAPNLIINTDISPEQLPELCGFSSKTYFYQVIKKITGKTPETLRRTEKIKRLTENS
jgi:AraC-like DNA-binding protein